MLCAVCDGHSWIIEPAATARGFVRELCPACLGAGFRGASKALPWVSPRFRRAVALAERDGMNFERHAFAAWLAARFRDEPAWREVGHVARRYRCVFAARDGRWWRADRIEAFERGRALMRSVLRPHFCELLGEFERGPEPALV